MGGRHRSGVRRPVDARSVATNQTTPTASPVGGGLLTLCVAERQPDGPRHVDGGRTTRPVRRRTGQHAAARAVRGRHRARGITVELGQPGRCRSPGHGLGLPGARGPGRRRPLLRAGQPRRLRRLRRHLRPDLPDLPRHRVRDADEHRRRRRHRRPGDGHARRPDRHDRVLRVDRRLHLERQPGVAVHRGARRRRRRVRVRACNPNHHWTTSVSYAADEPPGPRSARSRASPAPTSDPGPSLRRRLRAGRHHHARRARRETITDPRHRVLRRPRSQLGSLQRDVDQRWRRSPSPAKAGGTASGWASGARSATPSGRTTATATGPTSRSWTTTTARPRWAAFRAVPARSAAERRGRRLLDQRRRRRRLQLRQRAVLRQHGRHAC